MNAYSIKRARELADKIRQLEATLPTDPTKRAKAEDRLRELRARLAALLA